MASSLIRRAVSRSVVELRKIGCELRDLIEMAAGGASPACAAARYRRHRRGWPRRSRERFRRLKPLSSCSHGESS